MQEIWRRDINEAAHLRVTRRFTMWYAMPAAIVVVLVAVLSSPASAAGVLILLGVFGLLLFIALWLPGRNRARHPVVSFDDQNLLWAKKRVPVADVHRFTTFQSATTVSVETTNSSTMKMGKARFHLTDDSRVEFAWYNLSDADLESLRIALDRVLPGRWSELN